MLKEWLLEEPSVTQGSFGTLLENNLIAPFCLKFQCVSVEAGNLTQTLLKDPRYC